MSLGSVSLNAYLVLPDFVILALLLLVTPFAVVCRSILTSLASILLAMVARPALEILVNLTNQCRLRFLRMVIWTAFGSYSV